MLTMVVGIVGLGATVLASNRRTRTELKTDISRLDDRVYALAAGLSPRLVPDQGDDQV